MLTDDDIRDALEAEFLGEPGTRNLADDLRVARAAIAAHEAKAAPAVPMSESQRADLICAVAAICTGTSSRTVAATAIEWTERYYGISTPSQEPAVPQGNDPAWTLAAKVREALYRKACPGYYMDVAVEAVVHNYAPAAPSQPLTDEYAGVIAWIGDNQSKLLVTEDAIKHEHTPGVVMRNTAHQCVQEAIIAALREKQAKATP